MNIRFFIILIIVFPQIPVLAEPVEDKQTEPPQIQVSSVKKDVHDARTVIDSVLSQEIFSTTEEVSHWRFDFDAENNKEEESKPVDGELLEQIALFIARVLEGLLWLSPLLILLIVYKYRRYWLSWLQGQSIKKQEQTIPDTVFGLDIRQHALPKDISLAANQMWQSGHHREAVSLLYRGALSRLFSQSKIELLPGATEQDCLQQVTNSCSAELSHHFSELTRLWVLIAYAHRLPESSHFDALRKHWSAFYDQDRVAS